MVRPFAGGGATPEHVNVITAADALALTHLSMPKLSGTAVAVLHEQAVEITALLIQIPGVAIHQVTPDAYEDDLRSEIVAGPIATDSETARMTTKPAYCPATIVPARGRPGPRATRAPAVTRTTGSAWSRWSSRPARTPRCPCSATWPCTAVPTGRAPRAERHAACPMPPSSCSPIPKATSSAYSVPRDT